MSRGAGGHRHLGGARARRRRPGLGRLAARALLVGSVFLVNIPIVVFALIVGWFLSPLPRPARPAARPARPGAVDRRRPPAGLGRDRGPGTGWTSPTILAAFGVAFALIGGFLLVGAAHRPRCSTSALHQHALLGRQPVDHRGFFALFGFVFPVTQYFQAVRGFSPLEAGVRTLPFAVATASPRRWPEGGAALRHQGGGGVGPHVDGLACSSPRPRRRRPATGHRGRRWSLWAAASASRPLRPPSRSWAPCPRSGPASARPSTTPPVSWAAPSASP